jgi:hypothetical protein
VGGARLGEASRAGVSDSGSAAARELAARSDVIEEAYEFFLAYAAQGLPTETGAGHQIREFLRKFDTALEDIAEFLLGYVGRLGVDVEPYRAFIAVIGRDARDAQAGIRLVLAQPSISSQIIDNLNASIHVRALLTDLFLIDEVLKSHQS